MTSLICVLVAFPRVYAHTCVASRRLSSKAAGLSVRAAALILPHFSFSPDAVNKHKPWLEPTYHGIVTENDNTVLLDPPLIALDKDSPLRFAGTVASCSLWQAWPG